MFWTVFAIGFTIASLLVSLVVVVGALQRAKVDDTFIEERKLKSTFDDLDEHKHLFLVIVIVAFIMLLFIFAVHLVNTPVQSNVIPEVTTVSPCEIKKGKLVMIEGRPPVCILNPKSILL